MDLLLNTQVIASSVPVEFGGADPSLILSSLQLLPREDWAKCKKFYSSYGTEWRRLDAFQRARTVEYFKELSY